MIDPVRTMASGANGTDPGDGLVLSPARAMGPSTTLGFLV
jgi:hypothetical protein